MNKWWKKDLVKGDVFKDKNGKEFMFVGWMHGTDAFRGRTAMCTAYRSEMYAGVSHISECDMVEHINWVSGFMTNEGT